MVKALRFAFELLRARARRFLYELSPPAYRRFQLAVALPRWRRFPLYAGLGPFESFPTMDKPRMLAEFPRLNRFGLSYEACLKAGLAQEKSRDFRPLEKLPCAVGLSSGTSGRRGVFLTTEGERLRWAASLLEAAPFLPLFRRTRVAFFLRSNSSLYEQGGGWFLRFRYFDLTLDFTKLWAEAAAFRPTLLVAPPAVLAMILELERKERKLFPEAVVSVADKLPSDLAAKLRDFFGVPLHEVYQATEGFLGITCRHGTLHLNEHLYLVERMSRADGAFEPVLSDYLRTSQAFVRFHLDDVLVPQVSACPCGTKRLALREVRGRADDVLLLPGRAGGEVALLPDFVRQLVQNELHADVDFLVVQRGSRIEVCLELEPPPERLRAMGRAFQNLLEEKGATAAELSWSFGLQRGLGEKRRRVQRLEGRP